MSIMPKRPRRPRDPNELAFQVFQEAIGEAPAPEPERERQAFDCLIADCGVRFEEDNLGQARLFR